MSFRRVGESGLRVSVVGLGTNNLGTRLDRAASIRVVHAALDHGVTLIDTADIYGGGQSEEFIGEALQDRRDRTLIATKFGMQAGGDHLYTQGGSRLYIREAVERSLRRLRTDHIDLYQMHRPDRSTPIEETLSVLDDLVHEGKVRYTGNSNFSGWQIADADWTARAGRLTHFISAQNWYNLLLRDVESEVVPACRRFGLGMLPYFPLASGLLTGKYRRGQPPPPGTRLASDRYAPVLADERALGIVERLERFAAERGISLLHVAIAGLAAQPSVASVIAGATSPEQVAANVAAGEWQPSADDLAEIDRITRTSG